MLSNIGILARLALAAILSGLIGVERERLLWAAGLRTHMLVGVGSASVQMMIPLVATRKELAILKALVDREQERMSVALRLGRGNWCSACGDWCGRAIGLASLRTLGTTVPQEVMARIPEVD